MATWKLSGKTTAERPVNKLIKGKSFNSEVMMDKRKQFHEILEENQT